MPEGTETAERFIPGRILAGRYRIIELVGEGGMGEVYRAQDLKLGQTVALKFLPQELGLDADRLRALFAEVRLARQVSHPNVSRVHDIEETEGMHFLSMEFIDGEDLASLLRRIGRLPGDKAAELAREICAGLAAIHDRGMLHRDLKPANVMIDGRGHARITDFGLAELQSARVDPEMLVGTPAYMAPEALVGGQASTVQSDLYALGLVLYEVFTGHRAFEATTFRELVHLRCETPPPSPTKHRRDLDPRVVRAIGLCLDRDPQRRPDSALAVAATLPGGDPLAAAFAAGKTPSPELVAAPTLGAEGLRLAIAWPLLAALVAGLALLTAVAPRTRLVSSLALPEPPEAMAVRARDLLRGLGFPAAAADRAYGYDLDESARVPVVSFWYRESPTELVPRAPEYRVTYDDPPLVPGMLGVMLDPGGRLRRLDAPGRPSSSAVGDSTSLPRPPPSRMTWFARTMRPALFLAALLLGGWLARRNLRAGRGDRKRALRLGLVMLGLRVAVWLLVGHHTASSLTEQIMSALAWGLYDFAYGWVFYMAIEPYFRRLWPRVLTAWVRLLDGRHADARVGRELLIGCVVGTTIALAVAGHQAATAALATAPGHPVGVGYLEHQLGSLLGLPRQLGETLGLYRSNLVQLMGFVVILVMARLTLRHAAAALAAAFLIFVPLALPKGGVPALDLALAILVTLLLLVTMMRFGLLAALVGLLSYVTLQAAPLGLGLGSWPTSRTVLALAIVAGVGAYGFARALAGRPAIKDVLAED